MLSMTHTDVALCHSGEAWNVLTKRHGGVMTIRCKQDDRRSVELPVDMHVMTRTMHMVRQPWCASIERVLLEADIYMQRLTSDKPDACV